MNDLKAKHAVEPNGMRHIVGGQCDSADALDHRDTLHMIRSVRAHRVCHLCHRLSRCFKYDFSESYWWHFQPRAVKCAKSNAVDSRFVSDADEGHACMPLLRHHRGPLARPYGGSARSGFYFLSRDPTMPIRSLLPVTIAALLCIARKRRSKD
jgi:hypothetical protein